MTDLYTRQRFILETIDPLHVGTGGTTLGRVDLSIVREPGTRLPKLPGTSLSGATRQYAAYQYGKRRNGRLQCAGQKDHCGEAACPICYTFGTANEAGGGYSGVVSFGDALLLAFPVYSMAGPVWVTSPTALKAFDVTVDPQGPGGVFGSGLQNRQHLNLGWLMVSRQGSQDFSGLPLPATVTARLAAVADGLFSQVVNANLEVRTSVSIDPETGAAEDGALFTYEALPRATFLYTDLILNPYRREAFTPLSERHPVEGQPARQALDRLWNTPLDVVRSGLALAEALGVGGMSTRGFGRIKAQEVS